MQCSNPWWYSAWPRGPYTKVAPILWYTKVPGITTHTRHSGRKEKGEKANKDFLFSFLFITDSSGFLELRIQGLVKVKVEGCATIIFWRWSESNRWRYACKAYILPAELHPLAPLVPRRCHATQKGWLHLRCHERFCSINGSTESYCPPWKEHLLRELNPYSRFEKAMS